MFYSFHIKHHHSRQGKNTKKKTLYCKTLKCVAFNLQLASIVKFSHFYLLLLDLKKFVEYNKKIENPLLNCILNYDNSVVVLV